MLNNCINSPSFVQFVVAMASVDVNFISNLPPGPLDAYRKRATFDWKQMKLFFEDAELLKVKVNS